MLRGLEKWFPARLRAGLQNRAWILVVLTIVFAVGVRVRLADMPLERDEGEYAYAGQLILQGVPPYQEAFNMKLPGTYLAYAASMAVFGQTPTGIHLGLALVNAATIWLMFLLGRKLLDPVAGVTAAITYALMSLSPEVLGLAGHATHYVMLPAVGGILVLLHAIARTRAAAVAAGQETPLTSRGSLGLLFASGALFGLAVVMKQHGAFFGLFGGLYLIWERVSLRLLGVENRGLGSRRTPRRRVNDPPPVSWTGLAKELAVYSAGCVLPYLLVCVWLGAAGVFPQFWFWTVSYGSQYATGLPLVKAADMISYTLRVLVSPNLVFWLLPWVGALMLWWEERLDRNHRAFLTGWLLFSLASISVGFYFREHYFIQLLPVLAILVAVAVSRSLQLLQRDQSIELFLALGVVVVSGVAVGAVLIGNGAIWFTHAPRKTVETIYRTTLFGDTRDVAEFIRANTSPTDRIAVIGSEPQIYFYSRRRSATGHIYTYALMELHPYAAKMQAEMMEQIEAAAPKQIVYVNNPLSWLMQPESEKKILNWWPQYWEQHYQLLRTIRTRQGLDEFRAKDPAPAGSSGNYLLLLERKPGEPPRE
jgi:4-amino-4-deoxy-L-arabinose transferase-like glycosyltransferase